ncbi:MAG: hypothetical protein IMF11_05690 [Proteobacteria bacterium]|nr:hypothetical protein [Pseudomonadota bacterium]
MLVYDIEIKKAILGKDEQPLGGVEYCEGWGDHVGMGVSCVCCYDYADDRYRVFCEDNMHDFVLLIDNREVIVGFNNINFDNKVLACHGGTDPLEQKTVLEYLNKRSYDILAEIRAAGGGWCGLDAMVKANNLATGKTGNGALAPVWYQAGRIGKLIDYCMADVWLTKKLLDKIIQGDTLTSSKTGQVINIRKP